MGLLYRLTQPGQAVSVEGEMPITSLYTAGIAGETFFRAIKDEGRLLATVCEECDISYIPPRLYCERCFKKLETWVEAPTTGHVHTYTIVHFDVNGEPLAEPQVIAFISIDGTDGGLVHVLGEVAPDEVFIGMDVEAVFKDPAERKGSILDIAYFRPL